MTYTLVYYLKGQSELFSNPQVYQTDDLDRIKRAVRIAKANGYKIVSLTRKEN